MMSNVSVESGMGSVSKSNGGSYNGHLPQPCPASLCLDVMMC